MYRESVCGERSKVSGVVGQVCRQARASEANEGANVRDGVSQVSERVRATSV